MVLLQSSDQEKTAVGLDHPQAALSNRGPSTEWGSGSDSRLGASIGFEELAGAEFAVAQRTWSRRSAPRRGQCICWDLFMRRLSRKLAVASVNEVPTGGFKRSSQRPDEGGCDEEAEAAIGSIWAGSSAVT